MESSFTISGFVCILVLFSFSLATDGRNGVQASRRSFLSQDLVENNSIVSTQYRTAYHFQPRRNWINDPNGPMYYNGRYHLFYQYNPYAAKWGNISWGHSVSTDLINWKDVGVALSPTDRFDKNGCFSGSATIVNNTPFIVYTGVDENNLQVQGIAYPKNLSNDNLAEWVKYDRNPILKEFQGVDQNQFRDPTTAWRGNDAYWRLLVGAAVGQKGQAVLYKSRDFHKWSRVENPFHKTNRTGMWECPDFFHLKGAKGMEKYALKMSLGETQSDHYMLGTYSWKEEVFVRDDPSDDYLTWKRYDYGKFYASKTFFDEKNQRRILWGWVKESDTEADDLAKGWSGIQSFPRVVILDNSGRQLLQWPIREIESLRREHTPLNSTSLITGGRVEIKGLTAFQADVEVEFELSSLKTAETLNATATLYPAGVCENASKGGVGPFGLLVLASLDLKEHTAISFKVFKFGENYKVLMCSDQRRSSMRPEVEKPVYGAFLDMNIEKDMKISLRTLIDHSVIESFGAGGKACITSRVYPESLLTGDSHLYAFNNGTETIKISKLEAWDMAKPQIS